MAVDIYIYENIAHTQYIYIYFTIKNNTTVFRFQSCNSLDVICPKK